MPLNPKASVSHNISEMVHAGHPQNQAIAAALSTARKTKANGGDVPITAYQGGPHSVGPEGYSNEWIGKGEGAQAFGHGHYLAEHEPTAQYYRDTLAHRGQIDLEHEANQRGVPLSREAQIEIRRHANGNADPLEAAKHMHWSSIEARQYPQEKLADLINVYRSAKKGHMHQVAIHAHPDHFLDWNKPLSEQSEHIVKSIFDARKDNPTLFNVFKPHLEKDSTGMNFYQSLATKHPNGYQGASNFLQRAGIRGIKYLDPVSSAAGTESHNYVVFDPKDIEIMRRYAQGGDVSAWHPNHPIHRTAKADGGGFSNNQQLGHVPELASVPKTPTMGNKVVVHEGPIHSPVAGRTDHLPMHVKSGSYVIPADIIGAMGEGNTMAGFKVARRMFSSNPYFQKSSSPYGSSSPIYNSDEKPYGARAAGGGTPGIGHNGAPQDDEDNDLVPIVAAGGEYVISPQDVTRLGKGDIDDGHKTLDSFVTKYRKKTIKVLQNLPGPKRD